MKHPLARKVCTAITLAIVATLCLTGAASATAPLVPLYPPGPPYSRLGPGGTAANFWSESGQGNPQFFRSGSIFWWQTPPLLSDQNPPPPVPVPE
jgi:hypothetical protein